MVTKAKRASNNAWDKANMTVLGCKVRRDYADRVRATAEENGDSVNAVIKDALDKYLEENERKENM